MQSVGVRDEESAGGSRKRVGDTEPGAEDSERASKRVATDRPADALEESTRTPLPDDNVTSNPDVFCSKIVSSTTVTEFDSGISLNVQEYRRVMRQAFVTAVQRKRRVEVLTVKPDGTHKA